MSHRIRQLTRLARGTVWFSERSRNTIAHQLARHAARSPDKLFLRFENERYTYGEANALVNRHAHAYAALGIESRAVVALLMENRPQFLWHLFGLHKIGAVAALINAQLTGEPLAHAVRICGPSRVVVGAEVWPAFAEAARGRLELPADSVLLDVESGHGVGDDRKLEVPRFAERLAAASDADPPASSAPCLRDLAAYIYTSGTTGLPKAALVRHERLFRAASVWSGLALGLGEGDVLYNCLPLYHSSALMLGTGSVITAGGTMALARKFSRARFWHDVREHGATSFLYIGELCRYLANAPERADDRRHRVRVITGNGLRPDVWRVMRRRFGIRRIREFYGATEGNCVTLNVLDVPGSVGPMLPNMALARWDEERDDFERDAAGFLVKAGLGETGLLLGRIRGRATRFDGYLDREASRSKVVRDAFRPGDAYFNTGDLLRLDHLFHLHFVDRVGDTFRWKGENVSTGEVQLQVASWPAVADVTAYGVRVPGTEGRAGMVALVLAPGASFDPAVFQAHVDARLAGYARPLFVRLVSSLELTSTFKLRKVALQKEGFDPAAVADPLYFRDPRRDAYVRLDAALHSEIASGRVSL